MSVKDAFCNEVSARGGGGQLFMVNVCSVYGHGCGCHSWNILSRRDVCKGKLWLFTSDIHIGVMRIDSSLSLIHMQAWGVKRTVNESPRRWSMRQMKSGAIHSSIFTQGVSLHTICHRPPGLYKPPNFPSSSSILSSISTTCLCDEHSQPCLWWTSSII